MTERAGGPQCNDGCWTRRACYVESYFLMCAVTIIRLLGRTLCKKVHGRG